MFLRMLVVIIAGVMVGFVAARSVRVPPMPAVVQADVDLTGTANERESQRVLRMYDVQDIVDSALADERRLRSIEPPQLWLNETTCFCFAPSGPSAFEHIEDFISIVTGAIDPDTWDINGGDGTIRYFDGRLIVTQTPGTQSRLALFLDQLRGMRPQNELHRAKP